MDEDIDFTFEETPIEDIIAALDEATSDESPEEDDESPDPSDADQPTEDDAEDDSSDDEDDETDPDETDDEDDQAEDEDTDDEEPSFAPEDAMVKFTVDGEERQVSVSELTRLAGQEASLTKKSQAVADMRRSLESQGLYFSSLLQKRYESAKANAAKYADVDLFKASRELTDDEFDAIRSAKENADSELKAIETEANEFVTRINENRTKLLKEQAASALVDIKAKIPDWNDDVYTEVRAYAVSQGMDPNTVNEIVDPGAIIMIHKALQFDKAKQTATEKVVPKVKKAPKKVAKKGIKTTKTKASKAKAARATAMQSGDLDDIVALMDAEQE